jgi:hypothetical protein
MKNNYRPTKRMMKIREKVYNMVLNKYENWKEAVDNLVENKGFSEQRAVSYLLECTIKDTEYYDVLVNTEPRYHNYDKVRYALFTKYKNERREPKQIDVTSSIRKMKRHIRSLNHIITALAEQEDLSYDEDDYIFDMGTCLDEFEVMVNDYKRFAK